MLRWTPSAMPDLTGRTALVTGANSGIGFHTARELAAHGARVLMACRNPERANDALMRIKSTGPRGSVELVSLDLTSLASVTAAAEGLAALVEALDLLVNNAGIMAVGKGTTEDGFELQLGTNHLGHFALTGRLLPVLLRSQDPRVVSVSSYAHVIGRVHFDALMGEARYGRWKAYGQSKLANLLFILELDRRAAGRLTAVAAHPGYAATHLQQGQGQPLFEKLMALGNTLVAQSDVHGAWPTLRAATDPDVRGNDFLGPLLVGMRGAPVHSPRTGGARNRDDARRLWEVSEELTGVRFELSRPPYDEGRAPSRGPGLQRRCGCQPLRLLISSVSAGTTVFRSPTRPKSASSKIGASGSLLMATMVFDVRMPARCWMAPEMPAAM